MIWRTGDPRIDINKRSDIVIARPNINGRGKYCYGHGSVETKHAYCIWTDIENHEFINERNDWDQGWLWTYAPHEINIIKKDDK